MQWHSIYKHTKIAEHQNSIFDANSAEDAAHYIIDGGSYVDFEKPVTSAAAIASGNGFELGTHVINS